MKPIRPDLQLISGWVADSAHVLDLGCGDGALLKYLREAKRVTGYGVEIDDANILAATQNGVNVLQVNLEDGLANFNDQSFDWVILSLTLQAIRNTEKIVREMARVGREVIVSFPNFGYKENRAQIAAGRMPVSAEMPYQWHDTPNIHLCTMADFAALCASTGMHVKSSHAFTDGEPVTSGDLNLEGALAVFRFSRASA
jgi:methionine biosynthesis protein MetW